MAVDPGDILAQVFRHMSREDFGEVSMDGKMLKVLLEVDGRKKGGDIARKLGMAPEEIAGILSRLMDKGMIEPVSTGVINGTFFKALKKELALAIGPLAEVLIENALLDLGMSEANITLDSVAELVDVLARQIPKREKRAIFQRRMLQILKKAR